VTRAQRAIVIVAILLTCAALSALAVALHILSVL
jgi:hypothetical protein